MIPSKSHRAYFKAAKAMSKLSDYKQKIGCVVVYKHRIISSGFNHHKTNPLQKKYNKYRFDEDTGFHSVHAETFTTNWEKRYRFFSCIDLSI